MAVCSFQRTVYKSGGSLARARVEYITRQGPYQSPADARIQHQGVEVSTGQVREDLVYWRARNLPQWAKDDPVRYFSEAEKREGANRVAYTEWRFALPRELTHSQNMDLARDVLQMSFGQEHPYCFAFHDPPAADGGTQPHVHVLWSARTLDGIDRAPEQFFKRWNAKHPERGGAEKDPALNHFGAVKASRVLYSDIVNMHLEHAGHGARLHPDRLVDRGFDRTPEPKLLPSDSNRLKYHAEVTKTMQQVFDHRYARAPQVGLEQSQARTAWDRRKMEMGITRAMTRDATLQRIREGRELAVERTPARVQGRELTQEIERLEQRITGLERYLGEVRTERTLEEMVARSGRMRPVPDQWRSERTLARGREHGLPRDLEAEKGLAVAQALERGEASRSPERTQAPTRTPALARVKDTLERLSHGLDDDMHGGLHVRLHDKERDEGRELGF